MEYSSLKCDCARVTQVWPMHSPDGVHLSTTYFIHKLCHKSFTGLAQILDFLEFCLVLQLITGRGNATSKFPARESVMSCGARDNVTDISACFNYPHRFQKKCHLLTPSNYSLASLSITTKSVGLSCVLSSNTLFCIFCCSCLVCNLGTDWAASVHGSWDRLIMVDKGNAKGLSWCGCVGDTSQKHCVITYSCWPLGFNNWRKKKFKPNHQYCSLSAWFGLCLIFFGIF